MLSQILKNYVLLSNKRLKLINTQITHSIYEMRNFDCDFSKFRTEKESQIPDW